MARAPKPDEAVASRKNARVADAIDRAIATARLDDLLDQLDRGSGLPGPRPNLDFARAVGQAIAARRADGERLVRALGTHAHEYPKIVAAMTLAARAALDFDRRGAHEGLQELAEDARHLVRIGVVAAIGDLLRGDPATVVVELAAWTDGYLQAHVALEALADRRVLDRLSSPVELLARLDEAFALADQSPRAAERAQGVRVLRESLPAQITAYAARFSEVVAWLEGRARSSTRPETRDVLDRAITSLRRASLKGSKAKELGEALASSAKPPRDPSRLVHGTRRRGKG